MEVPGMGETNNTESHMTSSSAFVEGGIQEACEDACSICLEAFCKSDPSSVTSCKHEFHLQCILEWCQRSSNCPMCWQSISLKDPTSQELLEAVERERSFSFNPTRNSRIFHHPTLGDLELQHLPVDASDIGLEDHIIQYLAVAAIWEGPNMLLGGMGQGFGHLLMPVDSSWCFQLFPIHSSHVLYRLLLLQYKVNLSQALEIACWIALLKGS